ncbi:MAG: PLP-dependent aminotransferase family protein [Methanomicrobia archaeon]|nr:PLP-dependent aminotransferase family protein [Methanomicrobia archaeon]RLF94566.1 MAG: aminotransferase [Thermococci archaeon]RLG01767.1 MAG: aminotransferase [Thermococci archaeon]
MVSSMEWKKYYSERAKGLKASEIRELLKMTQKPEIISFGGGLPSPDSYAVDQVKECIDYVMETKAKKALQYGTTEGYSRLREFLADYMKKKGYNAKPDDILVTAGSQQGLDLVSKVFIDKDDTVITESPSYLGGLSAFRAYLAKIETIPLQDDGMNLDILEERLKTGKKPKFIYVVSTFQNPAGICMSTEKRKKIVEISLDYGVPIIEDNPYSELAFSGEPPKPILAYSKGNVLYLGTFSKTFSPGIRVAWVCGPTEIVRKLTIAKQSTDLCSNVLSQRTVYEYCHRGYLEENLKKLRKMYKRKRDIMLKAMEDYFPEGVKWTKPEGGLFLWVTLPEYIDTKEMFEDAIKNNVAYVVGTAFAGGKNTMRLNFSYPSDEDIVEGIKRLAEVIKSRIK